MRQGLLNLSVSIQRAKASMAVRMDEAAAAFHPLWLQRSGIAIVAVIIATQILPLWICGLWFLGHVGIEIWCRSVSRKQFHQQAIDPTVRCSFTYNLIVMEFWWALLGILCISAGTLTGQICGIIILVTLANLLILLFHTIPALFLVAGALPPMVALAIFADRYEFNSSIMLPIWVFLGLCLAFVLGRAANTPSTQQAQRRLKDALDNYKILTDNITDFIGRTDLNGVYQYASPSVYTVLGYTPEELVGMRIQDLLETETANFEFSGQGETVAHPNVAMTVTLRVKHKLGHWVWLQTSAKLVVENGLPVGLIGASRDVTEYVAADLALQAAKAEAEEANKAKALFLANMSHEIRTPMNAVLGALHLLDHEPISQEGRRLVDQALICGEMLTQIVNDVLDFSKIEAGELSLSPEPMSMSSALEGVVSLLAPQAKDKGIELSWQVIGEHCWIEADSSRLRQALFNLIGNAVKFTREGSVKATLSFLPSSRPDYCRVKIEVEDTGIGIPDNLRSQMFQRFQQASARVSNVNNGTGLGLAISKALVDMMGGTIDYSSVEGQGSRFWMEFEAPLTEPLKAKSLTDYQMSGVRVLLVEDNTTNRLMARTMLTSLGAEVIEAENGLAGLVAVISGTYDIILMDIQMPIMDGVEATRAIRALAQPKAGVPIIGLTANAMAHQRLEYQQVGMNGIVTKPISPSNLISEVLRQLSHSAG
jgi:PAS domain S-box-containing protein